MNAEQAVFISYRRTNIYIARAVREHLIDCGFDVFIDFEDIGPGIFESTLLNQIAARAHFIAILTPSSLVRCLNPNDYVRREIEYAMDLKRNLVPLMFEGFTFDNARPYLTGTLARLREHHSLVVPDSFFEEAMNRLCSRYLIKKFDGILHPISRGEEIISDRKREIADRQPVATIEQIEAETYFEKGLNSIGDRLVQIEFLNRAIALNPKFAAAYYYRGRAYSSYGENEKAIEDFETALRVAPDDIHLHMVKALLYLRKKELESALVEANLAVQKYPDDYDAYFVRARVRSTLKDRDGSIQDYTTSIHLNPNYVGSYNNRGNQYRRKGDLMSALEDYALALGLMPSYAPPHQNRGEVYFVLNDYEQAMYEFKQANALRPAYPNQIGSLAITNYVIGQLPEALRLWQILCKLDPRYCTDFDWVNHNFEWDWHPALITAAKQLVAQLLDNE